jgi:hypothetical protein
VAGHMEQQDALFVNLVLIFQNAAMQQMGKITNPMTGEIDRNLEQARFSIDMIDMLKNKTSGNLSPDLEKLLDTTLTNLRMNYVEEANKEASEDGRAERDEAPPEQDQSGAEEPEGEKRAAGDKDAEGGEGVPPADDDDVAGSDKGPGSAEEKGGKAE